MSEERLRELYETFPYPAYGVPSFGSINHDIDAVLICGNSLGGTLSGLRVLDVGCGTGEKTVGCALLYPELSVVGVDLSGASICRARGLADDQKCTNVTFVNGEITTLAEDLGKFDIVVCVGAAMLTSSPSEFIRALSRCLQPNGALSLYMYAPYGRQLLLQLQRLTGLLCTENESLDIKAEVAASLLEELKSRSAYKDFLTFKSFLAPKNRALRGDATRARIADQMLQPKEQLFDLGSIERMLNASNLYLRGFLDDLSEAETIFDKKDLELRSSLLPMAARKEVKVLARGDVNEYKLVATFKESECCARPNVTNDAVPRARRTLLECHSRFLLEHFSQHSTPVLGYSCAPTRFSVSPKLLDLIKQCDGVQKMSEICKRMELLDCPPSSVMQAIQRLVDFKIVVLSNGIQ